MRRSSACSSCRPAGSCAVRALRNKRLRACRLGPRRRIGLSLVLSLVWAPSCWCCARQLGLPLLTLAQDCRTSLTSCRQGAVALVWGIARTAWAYAVLLRARRSEGVAQIATT
jgi:hypothetical protein